MLQHHRQLVKAKQGILHICRCSARRTAVGEEGASMVADINDLAWVLLPSAIDLATLDQVATRLLY
jgi:hypothetical protein